VTRGGRERALALGLLVLLAGCGAWRSEPQAPEVRYLPDRRDYREFAEERPEVLEPNYLPFMAYPFRDPDGEGFVMALCRWPEEAMPLAVWVETPEIPEGLQDEFDPKDPAIYAAAVTSALRRFERELEGFVRFRLVEEREDARLELRLVAEEAPLPDPDKQVLGAIPLGQACKSRGRSAGPDRLDVEFRVEALRIYLADRFGLLNDDQVEWIALHEIGHALGMRSHSPIPADLMYEIVRDRVMVRELSAQDVNSFVSLYRLPNGTVFTRLAEAAPAEREPPPPPSGPPELALAPHVDPRLGFDLHPPDGWMRVAMPRGVAVVDGVTWDYSASFQVIVERYPTIEAYLARYGPAYLSHGWILENDYVEVDGHRALRVVVEGFERGFTESVVFIESGDGRVVVVIADAPVEVFDAYRPWFDATLASLSIWPDEPGGKGRAAPGG